jgi:hypothetical protein
LALLGHEVAVVQDEAAHGCATLVREACAAWIGTPCEVRVKVSTGSG